MAKACPECGAPIDPEWAKAEAEKELKKLEEVPFTVVTGEDDATEDAPETLEDLPDETVEEMHEKVTPPPTPEPPHTPDPPKNGHAGRNILIAAVVLVVLIGGGLYYYDYSLSQQREERAYMLLQDCSNPDFYEDFIVRFPKSKYIEDVRARYKEVSVQQNEWQKLVQSGSRDELRRFVHQHPTSPYVKVAQVRIDSLDWAEAQRVRTVESVSEYLANHPDGYYIDRAETLRQTLERQRAAALQAKADSIAAADSLAAVVIPLP